MKHKTAIRRLVAAVICGLFPLAGAGQIPADLIGTWVIDAKQTEEHLIKLGPPPRNGEWIPSIILRLCLTTMTFEEDRLIYDPISPAPMVQSFSLEPQQDKKLTYTIQTANGGKDTLTISFLNKDSITVKTEKIGLDEYGVWKRGMRPNRQTAQNDYKQAFDSCASALNNVPFVKAKAR